MDIKAGQYVIKVMGNVKFNGTINPKTDHLGKPLKDEKGNTVPSGEAVEYKVDGKTFRFKPGEEVKNIPIEMANHLCILHPSLKLTGTSVDDQEKKALQTEIAKLQGQLAAATKK